MAQSPLHHLVGSEEQRGSARWHKGPSGALGARHQRRLLQGRRQGGITGTSLSSRLHFWGGEGRERGVQESPKPITCRRKRCEKDLGDTSLISGRLSRGEPP